MTTTTSNTPKKYEKQTKELEKLLAEMFALPDYLRVTVYAIEDDKPHSGFRIEEIDIHSDNAGECFQRSTLSLGGLALILAAEDFVRTAHIQPFRPQGWNTDLDVHEDAKDKLRYVVGRASYPR